MRALRFWLHRRFVARAAAVGYTPAPHETWPMFRDRVAYSLLRPLDGPS